ncbi:MAG: glycosyltransferase [Thermoanaerobaculia bacterium]|nr:glycosyltransferase [Thermoanaerobaculia bacterium]
MRILLTNHTLDVRSGSELYVRDVALALLAREHEPIACSRHLGEVARELRQATVSVVDDPDCLSTAPDLIHAQHHLEAMTALTRFPEAPAIYVCHGWLPSEEAPPLHPRILRYVAVDQLVRQRLVDECGISPERVVVHHNFVDLQRFRLRAALARPPTRALVFSHQISETAGLPELRLACESHGIQLDGIGRRMGSATATPEEELRDYDIVFAKARAAMEALAVGCAVVLCDAAGLGPMVTSADLERLRSLNFGVRLLRYPITVDGVAERLQLYDPDDARAATHWIRENVGLDRAVDKLVQLYDDVLTEHASSSYDQAEQARAVSRYLRRGPLSGGDFFQQERSAYQVELARSMEFAESLSEHLQASRQDQQAARSEQEAALQDQQALGDEVRRLSQELQHSEDEAERQHAALEQRLQKMQENLTRSEEQISEAERQKRVTTDRLQAEIRESSMDAERLRRETRQVTTDLAAARQELEWMRRSLTWRLRQRLANVGWLVRIYRVLRGLER